MESVEYVEGILPIKENILGNAKAEYGWLPAEWHPCTLFLFSLLD